MGAGAFAVLSGGQFRDATAQREYCGNPSNVRFTPECGHVRCNSLCPLCAKSGLMQRSKGSLFDQLVGDRKQIRWDIKTERFGGCEVDDEIDLACQLNRHIGGCRPFENPASVDAGTTIGIGLARSVAHKDAGLGEAAKGSARRQRVAWLHRDYLPGPISIDIPTTRLTYVTFSLPLHRKRKQRCMRFAKSWDCLENLPASMAARLRAIVLRAKSRKSLTIVKRISSIPMRYEVFRGRLTNEVFATSEADLVEFINYAAIRNRI